MSTFEERIDPSSPEYCDYCNYDVHTCPGCGDSLPHGVGVCEACQKLYADEFKCPICEKDFKIYEGMRKDIDGKAWCKKCQDEHDNIDWGEVAEKRMGM